VRGRTRDLQRRRLAPVSMIVIASLLAVATAGLFVGVVSDRFDNWAPTIATEALFVALVVGVIDRLVRRGERERLRPRLDRVEEIVTTGVREALEKIAYDYVRAHPLEVRRILLNSLALIDLWLDGLRDGSRSEWGEDGRPIVLAKLEDLASALDDVRLVERELISPRLVTAMDTFSDELARARAVLSDEHYWRGSGEDRRDDDRAALTSSGNAFRALATVVVEEYGQLAEIPPWTRRWLTMVSDAPG
jgi:hypothetical protein